MEKYIIYVLVFLISTFLLIILLSNTVNKKHISLIETYDKENITISSIESNKKVFTSSTIPENILKKMKSNSIPNNNIKDLSYLQITYWGFDETTHIGEMIVNKSLAQEVLDIFEEVYEKKYPIEKIKLIDEYNSDDEISMEDNNTSAFCYRVIANTNKLSKHSLGTAIDINPLYNPYIVGSYITPANSSKYTNRTINEKGIIKRGDDLYNAFIKRGWTWGGDWKSKKDYQHFEKEL